MSAAANREAELAVVRHALATDMLDGAVLREALLVQDELQRRGRPISLIPLLRARYLRTEDVLALSAIYRDALLPSVETVVVPDEVMARSAALASGEEPEWVRRYLGDSGAEGSSWTATTPGAQTPLAPPRTIGGYRIIRELGRGAMGVVYEARHDQLGRHVALKVMQSRSEADRFEVEARVTARLKHPGIVTIHDRGEDGALRYLVMDLVEGPTLDEHLARGPLEPRESTRLAERIARAVDHAHQAGVLHRDLKPQNVLLANGEPVIVDFGLARDEVSDATRLTATGDVVGTPYYMAPEQILGERDQIDRRTDVWALGVILYTMLTGRVPFNGDTHLELHRQVCGESPVAPSILRDGIDPDLATVCLKCLEKDRERRYQTAGELADDLARCLEGAPIRARRRSFLSAPADLVRAQPLLTLLVCATLGTIAVALVPEPSPPPPSKPTAPRRPTTTQPQSTPQEGETSKALLLRASTLLEQGELAAALTAVEQALERDPNSAPAYNLRGEIALGRRELVPALSDFKQAIDLEPTFAAAWGNMGRAAYSQRDLGSAVFFLRRAVELDGRNGSAFLAFGKALRDTGDPEQARACLARAVQLLREDPAQLEEARRLLDELD